MKRADSYLKINIISQIIIILFLLVFLFNETYAVRDGGYIVHKMVTACNKATGLKFVSTLTQ